MQKTWMSLEGLNRPRAPLNDATDGEVPKYARIVHNDTTAWQQTRLHRVATKTCRLHARKQAPSHKNRMRRFKQPQLQRYRSAFRSARFIIARGGWWKPQAIHHPFLAQSLRQEGRTREVWLPRGSPNIYTGAMESRDAQPSARFVAWVVSALTGKISSKRKSTQGPKIATGSLFPILIWSQAAFYQSATQNVMHQHSILEN